MLVSVVRHPFRCSVVHHLCHEKYFWMDSKSRRMDIPAKHAVRCGWIFWDLASRGEIVFLRRLRGFFGKFFADSAIVTPAPAQCRRLRAESPRKYGCNDEKPFEPSTGRGHLVRSLPAAGRTGKGSGSPTDPAAYHARRKKALRSPEKQDGP